MSDIWEGLDVRKEQRKDKDGTYLGVYVLYINGREHSEHPSLNRAEREYLKTKGIDRRKWGGRG